MDERTKVSVYLSPEQIENLKAILKQNNFEYPDHAIQYAIQYIVDHAIQYSSNRFILKPEK